MSNEPIIRRRTAPSRRRRDGLIRFAKDITSQNGEDGIISRIFELLASDAADQNETQCWCVDVGAWDGKHLSNTHSLLIRQSSESKEERLSGKTCSQRWRGILIEADSERFQKLRDLHAHSENLCLNLPVSVLEQSPNRLENILKDRGPDIQLPKEFDFLCIDIDGADYWVLHDLWNGTFCPKLVCVEFNPTMPDDLIYIPSRSDSTRHGASLSALVDLAKENDYVLVETTLYNAFFVQKRLYEAYLKEEVPDTSIEALHEITMGTSLYQLYDGTIKLWGCKKLLWHRLPMDESRMQVLSMDERHFPFAPQSNDFDVSIATVDMGPYCLRDSSALQERQACAKSLLQQLKRDGFAFVRGTGISQEMGQETLAFTNCFLQQADESVRRSCLTKDRARRGYSPMCTENFASLIGEQGPNDLVRKFRIGPIGQSDSPNVWPQSWDLASAFRSSVEGYYEAACGAARAIVHAICDALIEENPGLQRILHSLATKDSVIDTSILTLLGYRVGTRHKGKNKGPMVAPHTDVGVITLLLFDNGNCSMLQRSDGNGDWVDVKLPSEVPKDPVFVVNIADCLSELCGAKLPSTLHRVVARPGKVPRNCCALFVGLEPNEILEVDGVTMTYIEWRKRHIARAQSVLRNTPSTPSP